MENLENSNSKESKEQVLEILIEFVSLIDKKTIVGSSVCYDHLPLRIAFEEKGQPSILVELHNSQQNPGIKTVFSAKLFGFNSHWTVQRFQYGIWVENVKNKLKELKETQFADFDDTNYYPKEKA